MTSTFTPNINLQLQAVGDNPNTWGTTLNNNVFTPIDTALGGAYEANVAGNSNVTLSQANALNLVHNLTGILTGSINYIFPANAGRILIINNATTGAYTVTVLSSGGTGVVVPQGTTCSVYIDPSTNTASILSSATVNFSSIASGTNTTAAMVVGSGASLSVTGNLPAGSFSVGTLGFSDIDILESLQSSANNYNQMIIQNTNSGNQASANYIVCNDISTGSTSYGEFGITSSGYVGTGPGQQPNVVFLASVGSDLAIGTGSVNAIHFGVNLGTDSITISNTGALLFPQLSSNGLIKTSGGTGAISVATAGTDYQAPITLTTTGTSGAATFISNTLNVPQYSSPVRAWVNFDGTTANNATATYARALTTVTVTLNGHGYIVGNVIYANITSGSGTIGTWTITAVTTNTFTYTDTSSGTTSGNVTLQRRNIRASSGIHDVGYIGTGNYIVNFSALRTDNNYVTNTSSIGFSLLSVATGASNPTTAAVLLQGYTPSTAATLDSAYQGVSIIGN